MPSQVFLLNDGDDDAQEYQDSSGFTASGNSIAAIASTVEGSRSILGCRFENLPIPNAATIHSAELVVNIALGADDLDVTIACHDVDNSPDFSASGSEDVWDRWSAATGAKYSITIDGLEDREDQHNFVRISGGSGAYTGLGFWKAVQEVVDRASWASGNAITFLIKGDDAASKSFGMWSRDFAAASAPRLRVSFDDGVPVVGPKRTVVSRASNSRAVLL